MEEFTSHDNLKIRYELKLGKKNTLIFLHGWPHNHTVWTAETDYFSKQGFTTIAFDLRGHGLSDEPKTKDGFAISAFARDLQKLIQERKIRKPILIGHSFGGMILLKFMKLFPDIAGGLVLMGTTFKNPLDDMPVIKDMNLTKFSKALVDYVLSHKQLQLKHFGDVNFTKFANRPDFVNWVIGAKNTSVTSVALCFREILDFDETLALPTITVPCLLIGGENDFKTPKSVTKQMNERIKHSKMVIIQNATHNTNLRNAKEINKAIENFLKEQNLF